MHIFSFHRKVYIPGWTLVGLLVHIRISRSERCKQSRRRVYSKHGVWKSKARHSNINRTRRTVVDHAISQAWL